MVPAPVLKSFFNFPWPAKRDRNSVGSVVLSATFWASSVPSNRGYSTRIICEHVGLVATTVWPSLTKRSKSATFCFPAATPPAICPVVPHRHAAAAFVRELHRHVVVRHHLEGI